MQKVSEIVSKRPKLAF